MKAYENPNSVFEGDRQKRVRVSQHRDGSKKRRYKNAKTERRTHDEEPPGKEKHKLRRRTRAANMGACMKIDRCRSGFGMCMWHVTCEWHVWDLHMWEFSGPGVL